MKIILLCAAVLALAGCESVPPEAMQPMPQIYQQLPVNTELMGSVELGDVRVDKDISEYGLDSSFRIDVKDYRLALQTALTSSKMAVPASGKQKYILDANLQTLNYPFAFFSTTVESVAHYQLRRADDNWIVMSETLKLSYKAEFSESFDATNRLRIALSNAIRENITQMIRVLSNKTEAELLAKGV